MPHWALYLLCIYLPNVLWYYCYASQILSNSFTKFTRGRIVSHPPGCYSPCLLHSFYLIPPLSQLFCVSIFNRQFLRISYSYICVCPYEWHHTCDGADKSRQRCHILLCWRYRRCWCQKPNSSAVEEQGAALTIQPLLFSPSSISLNSIAVPRMPVSSLWLSKFLRDQEILILNWWCFPYLFLLECFIAFFSVYFSCFFFII